MRRRGQVVQQTVAQLGELDAEGRARARARARTITGRNGDQRERFEDAARAAPAVPVRLRPVRRERGRSCGDVWLGGTLWRALQLDGRCAERMPTGREAVPGSLMAAVLVIARLCEPSSARHLAEDGYRRTALEDLLGRASEPVNEPRRYRALDHLLPHQQALERHLQERLGERFALEYDRLLYDVTRT